MLISLLLCCVRRVSSRVEETTRAAGVGLPGCARRRGAFLFGGAPAILQQLWRIVKDARYPVGGGYGNPLKKLCAEKSIALGHSYGPASLAARQGAAGLTG